MGWTSTPVIRSVCGHRWHVLLGEGFLPGAMSETLELVMLDPSQSLRSLWGIFCILTPSLVPSSPDPVESLPALSVGPRLRPGQYSLSLRRCCGFCCCCRHDLGGALGQCWSNGIESPLHMNSPLGPGHLEEKQVMWATSLCFYSL